MRFWHRETNLRAAPQSSFGLFAIIAVLGEMAGVVKCFEGEIGIGEIGVGIGSAVSGAPVVLIVGFALVAPVRLLVHEKLASLQQGGFVLLFSSGQQGHDGGRGIIGCQALHIDASVVLLLGEQPSEGLGDLGRLGLVVIVSGIAQDPGQHQSGQGGSFLFAPETLLVLLGQQERVSAANGALHFQFQREILGGGLGLDGGAEGGRGQSSGEDGLHTWCCSVKAVG